MTLMWIYDYTIVRPWKCIHCGKDHQKNTRGSFLDHKVVTGPFCNELCMKAQAKEINEANNK